MKIIDNISDKLHDDLREVIQKGSRVSIAAASFSIFAFEELKKELKEVSEFRFLFTSPTFTTEKIQKEKREFFIPRLDRERNIYGSEFEVKLRNELSQKAIAKECAEWIRKRARFYSNVSEETTGGFLNVEGETAFTYSSLNGFTTVDLGCEKGNQTHNFVNRFESPHSDRYVKLFQDLWTNKDNVIDVTEELLERITTVYRENSPDFIYFVTLFNLFNEFLDEVSEDLLPNEATGFKSSVIWNMLYDFQQDAVKAIINKLEKFNGCILADSVGLGKTFTALAVIKYYENRNKSVLVLCPKKLKDNWITYKANVTNNPIVKDRLRYDVLNHTDLTRETGSSNGLPLSHINWGNYDLVVIDESHNFRNGGSTSGEDEDIRENRYLKLLNKVIKPGVKTKVLMLSATPVNNRFIDLRNQLALAYEGDSAQMDSLLNTTHSVDEIFRRAQMGFNQWGKLEVEERTTERLLGMLDFDFFELLDSVTIARSRKHIEKYYKSSEVGGFPKRLPPISIRPSLTDKVGAINYHEIYELLIQLNLGIYAPSSYLQPSRRERYQELYGKSKGKSSSLLSGREKGIRRLMSINLLKRLESSVHSFRLTVEKIKGLIDRTIEAIEKFEVLTDYLLDTSVDTEEFEIDDQNSDHLVGKKVRIALNDIDRLSWLADLKLDSELLNELLFFVQDITPEHDNKLQALLRTMEHKLNHPINAGNRKMIIFTAFSDTADYLYANISQLMKERYGINTALISGSVEGRTTCSKLKGDMNNVLTCFSPISKQRHLLQMKHPEDIDILIATDCISEGQNLQDCDYLINYDIHWNPVRIIQRFGRIDRIGSINEQIQLVNFWPDLSLDDYINLKGRVETRMKITIISATGDDNLISEEEKGELAYRKQQLERLMGEVVDVEEMGSGISIMDLGLNEFRLDLLEYMKCNPAVAHTPNGLHAVVGVTEELPPGVVYILKNLSKGVNINDKNRLHPFYMVYLSNEGEVICNHLSPKKMLDNLRLLCKGVSKPIPDLYEAFNKETRDGRQMDLYSVLLEEAIASIIQTKEGSDIDSLFDIGESSALYNKISGLDDFELITFLIVK